MTEPEDLVLPILREIRKDMAELRKDSNEQRTLLLQAVDYMRKMEAHLEAKMTMVHDDLELMMKAEILGRLTHFETTIDQKIDALEERIKAQ